ncbi:zf-DNL-domain-containing protein [Canariomyces notabilis]|uniref:Zf-DNL-domain-containing protein n=1 Tax=Canariomyces notabilis TaxID=2074819 RepID=A0AAN6TM16_9PEZI|nr:zf-DNL-domain-containing protein [Canariomyces arenarius]
MASKRAFLASAPCLARLSTAIPSRTAAAGAIAVAGRIRNKPRHFLPQTPSVPRTAVRLAHSIPRPRNPSPFRDQQQQQPAVTSTSIPSSSSSSSPPLSQPTTTPAQQPQQQQPNVLQQPHYELTFTCRPCGHRSRHRVSKQGYHQGSVLIACPSCRNRHVISDHLGIFGGDIKTVEDLLRARGELVKRGMLLKEIGNGEGDGDGDFEVWDDGSVTARQAWDEGTAGHNDNGGKEEREDKAPPGASFARVNQGEMGGNSGEGGTGKGSKE